MSDSAPAPAAAPEEEPGLGQRLSRSVLHVRNAVTGFAALITVGLGALFLVVPSWKPLPRDKIEASIEITDIEPSMTVQRWADLQFPSGGEDKLKRLLKDVPDNQYELTKDAFGSTVYVKLKTDGFKRRSVKLRAALYSATTRTPSKTNEAPTLFPDSGRLEIDAPSRSSVQLLFLQRLRNLEGKLFVRVLAYDDTGILAYADSKPFVRGSFVDG